MSTLKENSFDELSKLSKSGDDFRDYENVENEEGEDKGKWSTDDFFYGTKDYEFKGRMHRDTDTLEKRRTIYELDSFAPSSGPSTSEVIKVLPSESEQKPQRVQEIRYSASTGMPGIVRINLSPITQKIVGCVIGENLTTEYPWLPVRKDVIEDNIDLHSESSDFLAIKNEIEEYPESKILVGYAPSVTEEGQFYICLTEEGRDAILEHIHTKRQEHENRVRIARYKPLGTWKDLGSGPSVEENYIKNNRPLFELEVIATGNALESPTNFETRDAEEAQNIFLEFHPNRSAFGDSTHHNLITRQLQAVPGRCEISVQTRATAFASSCCQYEHDDSLTNFENRQALDLEALKGFIKRHASCTEEQVVLNAMWDIYANDYIDAVRSEMNAQAPTKGGSVIEHQSFHDQKITDNKVINGIWWDPLWSGFAFALYSRYSKNHYLTGPPNINEVAKQDADSLNYVLIWSFKDCLKPTLLLACPSEVTAVTTSPLNETIVVGGCANGQIVIWDVAGKIKEPRDAATVETHAQMKYKRIMKHQTTWIQGEVESTCVVRPAAMSSLKYSQQASVTQITWMSPFCKVDRTGKIISQPSNTKEEDLSCQFLTSSVDGSIAIWDLKYWPSEKELRGTRGISRKKLRKFLSMKGSSSMLKILDRVLKPEYVLVVHYPNESRPVVITALSTYCREFPQKQDESSCIPDDPTDGKCRKSTDEKSDAQVEMKLLIGTIEGDFGCITWEGLGFGTDDAVNRETCRWLWIKKAHDGPITDLMRSRYYPPAVATVGGKSFAIWHEDFNEPVFHRRSSVGYTGCSWSNIWPTVLILAQMDGTVEVWDLRVKSTEPILRSNLSGGIITGIYAHDLEQHMQGIGICEFNGNFRLMFLTPEIFRRSDVVDVGWMKNFVNRHVERMRMFKTWQQEWTETNSASIPQPDKSAKIMTTAKRNPSLKDTTSIIVESPDERWRSMELKRMQRVLLEKKGLQKDELETQYTPILEMRRARKRKKLKAQQILKHQHEIFYENVAVLRPEQYRECNVSFFLPEKPPTSGTLRSMEDPVRVDGGLQQGAQTKEIIIKSPGVKEIFTDEDIISSFLEIQETTLTNLANRPFDYSFDWQRVMKEGKTRRTSMDVDLRKLAKFK